MVSKLNIDCLIKIFEKLENDHKSLHSCILVNKLWCQYAIPELWKNPWQSSEIKQNNIFLQIALINTYISAFPKDSKEILLDNGFKLSSIESDKPLIFNYISLLRNLQIFRLESSIRYWLIETFNNRLISEEHKLRLLIQEFLKVIFTQSPCLYILNATSTYGS